MSKKITRNESQHGRRPNQESGVASAVEDITTSAKQTVSRNWKPLVLLLATAVVISMAIWIFQVTQDAQAEQLQETLYELTENPPAGDQVDTWIQRMDELLKTAEGQAAEKNAYREIVDALIQQANPSPSSSSFLSGPALTSKLGPNAEKNRIALLKAAKRIARTASSKPWADEGEKWIKQVGKLVDEELKPEAWLPESRSYQLPPTKAKAPK